MSETFDSRTHSSSPTVFVALLLSGASVLAGGCESNSEEEKKTGNTNKTAASEQTGSSAAPSNSTVELASVGDKFEFDRTSIELPPNREITVKLTNRSEDESIKHNYVQLDTDERSTAMSVAKAGWEVPGKGYVPGHESVLAATSVAGPGETVEVTFETPNSPGRYLYICTYPGHYPTMRGKLVVRK